MYICVCVCLVQGSCQVAGWVLLLNIGLDYGAALRRCTFHLESVQGGPGPNLLGFSAEKPVELQMSFLWTRNSQMEKDPIAWGSALSNCKRFTGLGRKCRVWPKVLLIQETAPQCQLLGKS